MLAGRWYLRFGLSYRDLEELLTEWRSYVIAELRERHPQAAEHVEAGGLLIDLDPDTKVWSKAAVPQD